jgi:hypothetical protein
VSCLIRKSSDQSLIDSSPKLIAVFHFLHRLLMPQASTNCPFQLTTNFAGYSNIEHSLIHIFQRSQIFIITTTSAFLYASYTQEKFKEKEYFGGDERIRTADLPRAKRSLCQLSYTPDFFTLATLITAIRQN